MPPAGDAQCFAHVTIMASAGRRPRPSFRSVRVVAVAVATGDTNQEIGTALHISGGTVKTHLEQVFAKFGVRSRVQVGVILERAGLGPVDL